MKPHRVWLETCKGCTPWTRAIEHPLTREPIVQALHEEHCHVWPKQHRVDTKRAEA